MHGLAAAHVLGGLGVQVNSFNRQDAIAFQERRALGLAALLALAAVLWLLRPVGMGVLLGVLMAFAFRPLQERLLRRWPAPVATLATVLGSSLAIVLAFGALAWILVRDGVFMGRHIVA